MKAIHYLIGAAIAVLVAASSLNATAGTNSVTGANSAVPAGSIKFINLELSQILPIYAALTDAQLDISRLGKPPTVLISFENKEAMTKAEVVRLLDKEFYSHGIVATHPDKKHVVFSYRSASNAK